MSLTKGDQDQYEKVLEKVQGCSKQKTHGNNGPCDLRPHIFTKEPLSLNFLQA